MPDPSAKGLARPFEVFAARHAAGIHVTGSCGGADKFAVSIMFQYSFESPPVARV